MGRWPRWLAWLLVGAALAVVGVVGLRHGSSPAVGRPAPALPRERLAGPPVTLGSLLAGAHGRPVVITFWASWCEPCAHEAPALQAPVRATPSKSTAGHHPATPRPRAGLAAVKWKSNPAAFTKSGSVFGRLPLMVRPVPRVCTASVETLPTNVAPLPAPSNHTPAVVGW